MKHILMLLVANAGSIVCVIISGILAVNQLGNWGWFLFAAWLLSTYVEFHDKP